jgi:hypothetical protein
VTVNPNQLISYRCANLKIEAQEIWEGKNTWHLKKSTITQ